MSCSLTAFPVKLVYNIEDFYRPRGISAYFPGKQQLSPSLFLFCLPAFCFLYYGTFDCYGKRSVWKYLSIKVVTFIPATAGWKVSGVQLPSLHSLPAVLSQAKACPMQSHVGIITIPEDPHCLVVQPRDS